MSRTQIVLSLFVTFVALSMSLRLALNISPFTILHHSHPLAYTAREHLYDMVASVHRVTFTTPCLFPFVSRHVPTCRHSGPSIASENSCQVLTDIMNDAQNLSDRLVLHATSSRDFTAIQAVVGVLDDFLSHRDRPVVPEYHRPLIDAVHEIRSLLTVSLKAIARVVAHAELTVSGCVSAVLTILAPPF